MCAKFAAGFCATGRLTYDKVTKRAREGKDMLRCDSANTDTQDVRSEKVRPARLLRHNLFSMSGIVLPAFMISIVVRSADLFLYAYALAWVCLIAITFVTGGLRLFKQERTVD